MWRSKTVTASGVENALNEWQQQKISVVHVLWAGADVLLVGLQEPGPPPPPDPDLSHDTSGEELPPAGPVDPGPDSDTITTGP